MAPPGQASSDGSLPDEFALIARLFAPLSRGEPGAYALRDDAATVSIPAGFDLVVTTDTLVAGVHFRVDDPPGDIARKLLRVNLSDLAAKGAVAKSYLLAVALPRATTLAWLESFADGLGADQARYDVHLIGGDTTATPGPLTLTVTALGHVPAGRVIRRGGAKPGDRLFVTGTIGDAGLGLAILERRSGDVSGAFEDGLIARYRVPEPRTGLGALLPGIAHAAIDVSDGLVADAGHVAAVSGLQLVIERDRVPVSPAAAEFLKQSRTDRVALMGAGDDYEILFTAPPEAADAVRAAAVASATPVTEIGCCVQGAGVVVVDAGGAVVPISQPGFRHF